MRHAICFSHNAGRVLPKLTTLTHADLKVGEILGFASSPEVATTIAALSELPALLSLRLDAGCDCDGLDKASWQAMARPGFPVLQSLRLVCRSSFEHDVYAEQAPAASPELVRPPQRVSCSWQAPCPAGICLSRCSKVRSVRWCRLDASFWRVQITAALAKPDLQTLEVEPKVLGRQIAHGEVFMKLLPQLVAGLQSPLTCLTDCRCLLLPAMPGVRSSCSLLHNDAWMSTWTI